MSSVATPQPRKKKPDAHYVEYNTYIEQQVEKTRRAVRLVDLMQAMLIMAIGLVGFLLTAALLEHWILPGGLGTLGRTALFLTLVGCGGYYVVRRVWPLLVQSINPTYAAQAIEREHPTLKNSLINFLLFRREKQTMPPAVYEALEEQAARRLSQTSVEDSVDRSALIKLGYVLLAVIAAAVLYSMIAPKSSLATAARVLMPWANIAPPSRVSIERIEPGDIEIVQGDSVEISAVIGGLRPDEQVELAYETIGENGEKSDERLAPLQSVDEAGKYLVKLPLTSDGFGGGIDQSLRYRITAGDGRSADYQITVLTAPAIRVRRIHYDFPKYTGYIDHNEEGRGDIHAVEGTKVTIFAEANDAIESAYLDLAADGRNDERMRVAGTEAQVTYPLKLDGNRRSTGNQSPRKTTYMLRFTSTAGLANTQPPQHSIVVVPDYAPEVELLEPQERLVDLDINDTLSIAVDGKDPDFALAGVKLHFAKEDGSRVHNEPLLTAPRAGRFNRSWEFAPAEYDLQPGDVVEYWAEATDNRAPQANRTQSDRKKIRIVGKQQGDQRQGENQKGEGDDSEQQENGEAGPQGEAGENGEQGEGEPASAGGEQGENGEQGQQGESGEDQGEAGEQGESGESGESGDSSEAGENGAPDQQGEQGEQGENGEQGESTDNGDSGEAGQTGEQQGEGGPEGMQNGEGGEQQNPGSQPNSNTPGEPASAGDERGERGERGEGEAGGEGQQGENDAQGEAGENGQAGSAPEGGAAGNDENSKPVANDGSDDAEAFEKIQRRLNEQEREKSTRQRKQGGGDPSTAGSDEGAPQNQTDEQAGENNTNDSHEPAGENPENANQENPNQGTEPTDTKPNGESQSAGGDEKANNSGDPGAGEESEPQGAPDAQREMQQRGKKPDSGEPESSNDGSEPPTPGHSKKESDSHGEQGGDRTGGGQEGGGQKAPREGTGSAGQNQAADEGAGQSGDQGPGETGQRGGQGEQADRETGEAGEQPGEGSQSRGEKTPGEPASAGGEDASGDDANNQSPNNQNPSGENAGSENTGGEPNPSAGQPGGNDGTADSDRPRNFDDTLAGRDKANAEYAREQTNLMLEELEQQLDENQVDQELLDDLGWSEADLRRFVSRWNKLRADAERPDNVQAQQELDARLKNLGPSLGSPAGKVNRQRDDYRDLSEGYQNKVPLKYRDRLKAYTEGVSKARE